MKRTLHSSSRSSIIALAALLAGGAVSDAQEPAHPAALTLPKAIEAALNNYPSIRVTQEQMNAAAAGIRLAQTAYLPRIDTLAQVNRATRNTFYGLLLPQSIIPGVDGVKADNLGSVWDSGLGILVSWQPFDFGLRRANVASATAANERAQAAVNRTRYDVSVATADAFLTVVAAEQVAKAAQASVESWQTLLKNIHALVASELRPGADESRLQAEMALAQTQLAQAEQAIAVARSNVAQFTGVSSAELRLEPGKMIADLPPDRAEPALDASANPLAMEQNAAIAEQQRRLDALDRTYYPQFSVQGLAAVRGTGLETDGGRLGGANGLAPTTQNYSVGLTVTFPVMDRFALREQAAEQSANVRAQQAQYQVITTTLAAKFNAALATLAGARRVAANTPVSRAAARTALDQATARYRSGLAPIDDVAQAQRVLVQAEIDDALARLGVWRALLELNAARGDIQPFLQEASQ